jgi:hypothetical protein
VRMRGTTLCQESAAESMTKVPRTDAAM